MKAAMVGDRLQTEEDREDKRYRERLAAAIRANDRQQVEILIQSDRCGPDIVIENIVGDTDEQIVRTLIRDGDIHPNDVGVRQESVAQCLVRQGHDDIDTLTFLCDQGFRLDKEIELNPDRTVLDALAGCNDAGRIDTILDTDLARKRTALDDGWCEALTNALIAARSKNDDILAERLARTDFITRSPSRAVRMYVGAMLVESPNLDTVLKTFFDATPARPETVRRSPSWQGLMDRLLDDMRLSDSPEQDADRQMLKASFAAMVEKGAVPTGFVDASDHNDVELVIVQQDDDLLAFFREIGLSLNAMPDGGADVMSTCFLVVAGSTPNKGPAIFEELCRHGIEPETALYARNCAGAETVFDFIEDETLRETVQKHIETRDRDQELQDVETETHTPGAGAKPF